MDSQQSLKCHQIIHSGAMDATGRNTLLLPGWDVTVDLRILTAMTQEIAFVLEKDILKDFARNLVIAEMKKTIVKREAKSLVNIIPGFGWEAGSAIVFAMIEATGWEIAKRLDRM